MPTIDYTLDGESLPGVTTVLRNLGWKTDTLVKWAHKLGREGVSLDETRDKAMDAGTIAHALIGARLGVTDQIPPCDEETMAKALIALRHWDAWRDAEGITEVLAAEVPLVSRHIRTGGCPDLVARDRSGRVWVYDWKTSESGGRVYREHRIQLAAYAMMWDELHPEAPCHGIKVVPLPTTTKLNGELRKVTPREWACADLEPDRMTFRALRVIHDQAPRIKTTAQKERQVA